MGLKVVRGVIWGVEFEVRSAIENLAWGLGLRGGVRFGDYRV